MREKNFANNPRIPVAKNESRADHNYYGHVPSASHIHPIIGSMPAIGRKNLQIDLVMRDATRREHESRPHTPVVAESLKIQCCIQTKE